MLSIVVRAFFPGKDFDYGTVAEAKDPSWKMLVPLFVFSFFIILFGVYSQPIVNFFIDVAMGGY